ncbi:hypothetical protein FDA48_01310 [Clostridium botulinum]|nr:hypothetical protein [Clostridium botulinum]
MEFKILDMKYVIKNGVDYNNLELEMFTNRALDPESKKGYTGLVYESLDEIPVINYAFYKDGFINGYHVYFHYNGNVESIMHKKDSIADGAYKIWNKENILIEEGENRLGIHTKHVKYSIYRQVIDEKKGPTDIELRRIKVRESREE